MSRGPDARVETGSQGLSMLSIAANCSVTDCMVVDDTIPILYPSIVLSTVTILSVMI